MLDQKKDIELIGAPVSHGAGVHGCDGAPAVVKPALLGALAHLTDIGDIAIDPSYANMRYQIDTNYVSEIAAWTKSLHEAGYQSFMRGAVPIFIGGDHSLAMGSVSGAARYAAEQGRELHVLWIDAHSDYNTPATSPSGNMHGMPVAYFCGEEGFGDFPRAQHPVKPENVHMIGIRSVDPKERELMDERPIDLYEMQDLRAEGLASIMDKIWTRIQADDNAMLHVSFDIDALDPPIAPAVGTPVEDGFTLEEAEFIMRSIAGTGLMTSLDIVELNPTLEGAKDTMDAIMPLITRLLS